MSYTVDLSKLSVALYESMFGSSKTSEEGEGVEQRTWAGWAWSTGGVIAQEAVKISVPLAIAYFGGTYAGLKMGEEKMTGLLAIGGFVALSPEIAALRSYTTDRVVDGGSKAVVYTANKASNLGGSLVKGANSYLFSNKV